MYFPIVSTQYYHIATCAAFPILTKYGIDIDIDVDVDGGGDGGGDGDGDGDGDDDDDIKCTILDSTNISTSFLRML